MHRALVAVAKVSPYNQQSIWIFPNELKKYIRQFRTSAVFLLLFATHLFCTTSCMEKQASDKTVAKKRVRKPLLQNQHSDSLLSGKIDTIIIDFMKQSGLKGVSVAISQHEKMVYAKGFGYADIANNEMVSPQHLFRIASVSKLITATAIMKMVESGQLKLSDKMFGKEGILNEYTQIKDARALGIEVHHLLTHTGGWKNRFRTDPMFIPIEIAAYMKVKPPISLDVITQFMLSQKMLTEAGTFFDYSNFGYCLLGRVIERKTGMKYEDFVKQKVFNPLNITEIQIARNYKENKYPKEVSYYEHFGAKVRPAFDGSMDTVSRPYGIDIELLAPAGGWIASPRDLLRLIAGIDDFPNRKDILSKKTIDLMTNSKDSLRTIGWRKCSEDVWIRTGSLVGTQIVVARHKSGISWVFVTNTSSWRAHRFSYDIILLMRKIFGKNAQWKKEDLFEYQ